MTDATDPVNVEALHTQIGQAYSSYDPQDQERHVAMLRSVRARGDVAVHAEAAEDGGWTVTVCAADSVGTLAAIAGLFPAMRFDIESADVFTLKFPQMEHAGDRPVRRAFQRRAARMEPVQPTQRVLDVFRVRSLDQVTPDVWERFTSDLEELIGLLTSEDQDAARERLIDRVSETFRALGDSSSQFFPVSIEVSNDASPDHTVLTIRSADTVGFLYAFTNALSVLNVNIHRAEVRTVRGGTHDTFWVTDLSGAKIQSEDRIQNLRVAAALIKQFTHLLPRSPNPAQALRQFNALTYQILSRPDWSRDLRNLESSRVLETLAEVMGVSQFLWEDFLRMQHENLFPVLLDMPSLDEHVSEDRLRETLETEMADLTGQAERVDALNRFKDREMFRIDLRHITRRVGFRSFSHELSSLGDVVVGEAANLAYNSAQGRFGRPTLSGGGGCPWCVFALGKFGGREMGFGSDVELLFVYAAEGITTGDSPIENSLYFGEMVKTFLGALRAHREGIFEIDLRLRPYGDAGALACSFQGFNEFYSADGGARQLERMALVKLRLLAGDGALGQQALDARDAFVYSGLPLDVDNIRHLRHRQAKELVPEGAVSAKHSLGGVADVEYYVQSRQITLGHSDATLRVTNTLDAIEALAAAGHLSDANAAELGGAYGFLRRLIDALRMVRGHARDLTIPPDDSMEFSYLTRRLQYDSKAQLQDAIGTWMGVAGRLWDRRDVAG